MAVIKDGSLVLFQGDSITDAGRSRDDLSDLGPGYPMLVAAWFQALFPEKNARFLNRGLGGDRTREMKARWQEDCIELKPDIVSILVGINDIWRKYDSNDPMSVNEFEDNYNDMLSRTSQMGAQIIMLEPFVLPATEDMNEWREDLDPKLEVVRTLARKYGATLIPLDGLFRRASMRQKVTYWTRDGVHPSLAGHALIAQAWLKATGSL